MNVYWHVPSRRAVLVASITLFATVFLHAADPAPTWHQLKPGEFPPASSAHEMAGELIGMDHINRTGVLRQDRTDAIRRSEWDQAAPFTLLPFGSITYRGAPAELRDIPIGTHLHGQFYFDEKAGKDNKGAFTQVLKFEDDFSHSVRLQRVWRVDKVDLEKSSLTVTGVGANGAAADAKPTVFVISPATQIWKGRGFGELSDLAPGQMVLVNLTQCTLKGPGRVTDVWLDEESRKRAAAHQLEVHRQFEYAHGLPCWVDEVDNKESLVTVTLFAGFDPKLLEDFVVKESLSSAVAEANLRTYDQGSDRMRGEIMEVKTLPAPPPGSSGVRIQFKSSILLEGHRPKKILRIFAPKWKADDIPKEERIYQ
jgi:hypothetical protein